MNTETQHIWLPELGYFVVAKPIIDDFTAYFDIHSATETALGVTFGASCDGPVVDPEKDTPVATGYIQFCGCAHWKFNPNYHTFGGRDGPLKLATAMAACRDHAEKAFGGFI